MRRAIELAANAPTFPGGALIMDRDSGKILSEGWNKYSINPTFHGEIDAINQLVLSNPGIDANKLVLYTTAEPCPMCQGAILWASIEMVVFGTPIRSLKKWDGNRLTFVLKKWFVAVQHGNARSLAAYWNKSVTHFLQWRFHEGIIQNEDCILGWLFCPLDGDNGDGRRKAANPVRLH